MSVYVIAEAGSCHDGVYAKACDLVEAAVDARADAVKFQYWSDPDALANRRRVPDTYRDIYRTYALPAVWLASLRDYAAQSGIQFLCTAYLPQDVDFLANHVDHFKVASFEHGAADLLQAHIPHLLADQQAGRNRWLILSAGMGGNWAAAGPFSAHPDVYKQVKLLHCVSAYPAPLHSLRLTKIRTLSAQGFSDHSSPEYTFTGALAAAAGAQIIEAHLKLSRTDPRNPDAPHAMTPLQLSDYVRQIRQAEVCLGTPDPGMHVVERAMAQYKVQ